MKLCCKSFAFATLPLPGAQIKIVIICRFTIIKIKNNEQGISNKNKNPSYFFIYCNDSVRPPLANQISFS